MSSSAERLEHAPPGGQLALAFARAPDGRSYLQRQFASYPFHVCRAQYLDAAPAGMATLYLQSSAGGLFADDCLTTHITAAAHSAAHVTTQASTIVHRMEHAGSCADHRVDLTAADGAFLEYLSDPTILFPQAALRTRLRLRWQPSATVLLNDAFLSHDPGGNDEPFRWIDSELRVEDPDGRLLAIDRLRTSGADFCAGRPGICAQFRTHGTLLILHRGRDEELTTALRAALHELAGCYAGVSTLPNDCGVWLRLLTVDGVSLRAAMLAAWRAARLLLTGQKPAARRK